MHYARRFLTLAAALGVLFAGAQPANAVDFKVKGAFDVSFETSRSHLAPASGMHRMPGKHYPQL